MEKPRGVQNPHSILLNRNLSLRDILPQYFGAKPQKGSQVPANPVQKDPAADPNR
jgi:hypothetical protein